MAANSEEFKELLHCPICLELFDNPQILKCLHTLCNQCLLSLRKAGPIRCPNCRQVSSSGDIKKDFKMQSLLDLYNKTEANNNKEKETPKEKVFQPVRPKLNGCEICQNDVIKWGCIECVKLMCETCKIAHPAIPACRNHDMKSVETIAQPKRAQLEETKAYLQKCGQRTGDEKEKLKRLKISFLGQKADILSGIKRAEEDAKKEIEKHFVKVRQAVELKSLKYIVNLDSILHNLQTVEYTFKRYEDEICKVVTENDYLKLVYHTDKACKTIEQDINRASNGNYAPEARPEIKLQPQKVTISAMTLIPDTEIKLQPQKVTISAMTLIPDKMPQVKKEMQKLSVTKTQKASSSNSAKSTVPLPVATSAVSHPILLTGFPALKKQEKKPMETKRNQPATQSSSSLEVKPRPNETLQLKTFPKQIWEIEKQVTAECLPDQYYQLSCIGNEIWCTLTHRFDIYNTDAVYLRHFQNEAVGNPYQVLQTIGGDLLIAGNQGLFLFNKHEELQSKVCTRRYATISPLLSVTEEIVCGLDKWTKEAVAFRNICNGKWEKAGIISLPEVDDVRDTIKGNTKHLFVCLHSQGVICQHDVATGMLLKRFGNVFDKESEASLPVALKSPYLCQIDMNGWLLVCDSGNKRLVLFDDVGKLIHFDLGIELNPGSVLVDRAGKLWVYHNGMKLIKFQISVESEKRRVTNSLSMSEKDDLMKLI